MRRAALAATLALAGTAVSSGPFGADQCAAFWLGRDDFARTSAFLSRDPQDLVTAERFRQRAVQQTADRAGVDATIAAQRPMMALLLENYVTYGTIADRDLHERMAAACTSP